MKTDKTTMLLTWLAAAIVVLVAVLGTVLVNDSVVNFTLPPNMPVDQRTLSDFVATSQAYKSERDGLMSIATLVMASLILSAGMLFAFAYGRCRLEVDG